MSRGNGREQLPPIPTPRSAARRGAPSCAPRRPRRCRSTTGRSVSAPNRSASARRRAFGSLTSSSPSKPSTLPEVLHEQQTGRPATTDQDGPHAVRLASAAERIARRPPARSSRSSARCSRAARRAPPAPADRSLPTRTVFAAGTVTYSRESAGQSGDAVLRVALTLVRVAGRAVLATRLAMLAHAGPSLIDDDAVARRGRRRRRGRPPPRRRRSRVRGSADARRSGRTRPCVVRL